jgi:hypothetical protein
MLRYVELKTGYSDDGPARIGHVAVSRSGQTIYFNGRAFGRGGKHQGGNYCDCESGERYWISGVKKRGSNRHECGHGKIMIEETAVAEYLQLTGASELDKSQFVVIPKFTALANQRL